MLAHPREAVRGTLPPKVVHAYRVVRHTIWWPCEQEMVAARQFLSPTQIAIDVGANVGLFTAVLARRSKKVIAFEPNPTCAGHLKKVAPRNCEVIAKAVSDRGGKTMLRVPVYQGIPSGAGLARIFSWCISCATREPLRGPLCGRRAAEN